MNARRIAGSLVFAAAAAASIATSAPAGWELEDLAIIPLTEVPAGPGTAFSITSEARGSVDRHDGGELTITLLFRRIGDSFPSMKVRLISETDPSLNQQQIVDGETASFVVRAWETCEASPCFEDFRLEIENTAPGSTINVSGDVLAVLRGFGTNPDPDHEVVVEVTPLGDIP
jgi:hypothetical protein